jgi:Protein of unknown function (DUF3500)
VNRIKTWVLAFAAFCMLFSSGATPQTTNAGQTKAIVTVASAFLSSLSTDQREKVLFPFTPQKTATAAGFARSNAGRGPGGGGPRGGPGGGFAGEQYGQAVWSNFPVSDVPRPGLTLGSLSAPQRDAALHTMQVLLSAKGYQKVLQIMGSDQALSDGGTAFASGINSYRVGIFGQPSLTSPWMLQYGGHHLSLNITIAGERGVITPTLTGAQPSVYTSNGKTVRVLAQENDKAFALLNALDETQRKQVILNYRIDDLVLGPGHAGETIQPEGLKASALNEHQRAMPLDVISEWAGIVNDTYFAWSGPALTKPVKTAAPITVFGDRNLLSNFRGKVWAAI